MQRNEAMKWFWPFLAAAAVALWLSAVVPVETPVAVPEAHAAAAARTMIELPRIEVIASRSAPHVQARAERLPRRKQPG